jgi:perosamine synthetase
MSGQSADRVPVYKPDLSGNERRYLLDCLDSGWISSHGEYLAKFEAALGQFLGIPYCSLVSSGTTAIQTALGALGIGPGDEVIVPTLTYIASVNPILAAGATPVFVDSDPQAWQMDPAAVARKVTARTRAIMAVHLYGGMCDMPSLMEIARRHDLFVIEDCAEAFGSRLDGKAAGAFGNVACYSFFGNKTLTTGEGGLVATCSQPLDRRLRSFKGQGLAEGREYWHDHVGFNYRMTNLCAAIGMAQLERIEHTIARKQRLAQWYREDLATARVQFQGCPENLFHTSWMVSILLDDERLKTLVREQLAGQGIETRPFFTPAHTMPVYDARFQELPVAEDLARRGINLPSWPGLSRAEVRMIAAVIRETLAGGAASHASRAAA